jgi:hypothetical protein
MALVAFAAFQRFNKDRSWRDQQTLSQVEDHQLAVLLELHFNHRLAPWGLLCTHRRFMTPQG